jgi:hypothetical protein
MREREAVTVWPIEITEEKYSDFPLKYEAVTTWPTETAALRITLLILDAVTYCAI